MKMQTYGALAKKTDSNPKPKNTGLTKEEFIKEGKTSKTLIIVGFIAVFLAVIPMFITQNMVTILFVIPGIVCIIVGYKKASSLSGGYKMLYLDPAMKAEFGDGIHYPNEEMTQEEVLSSGLFKKQPNNTGKRLVILSHKGIPVTVSDIRTYTVETYTEYEEDDDGTRRKVQKQRNVYRFDGTCVVLKTNKTAACRVRLAQKGFIDDAVLDGETMQELYTRRDEKFSNYFAYGEDEATALQILNASFLQKVEELSKAFPNDRIAIDWSGERLSIALTSSRFPLEDETGMKDEYYTNAANLAVRIVKEPVELLYGIIN